MGRVEPAITRSPVHFTAAMADREEHTGAFWEGLPLPDQFPEPHNEGSDEPNQGKVGGTLASVTTEGRSKDHPQQCSPNLLLMLKAVESWRMPHARDREQGHMAAPDLLGEAQRADMVSGMETL